MNQQLPSHYLSGSAATLKSWFCHIVKRKKVRAVLGGVSGQIETSITNLGIVVVFIPAKSLLLFVSCCFNFGQQACMKGAI